MDKEYNPCKDCVFEDMFDEYCYEECEAFKKEKNKDALEHNESV